MIWLKVSRIPIPKLVVMIYHQTDYNLSFSKRLKCIVRVFIVRSDKFALPFSYPMSMLFSRLDHSIWCGATKSIKYLVSSPAEFRPSMNCSLH